MRVENFRVKEMEVHLHEEIEDHEFWDELAQDILNPHEDSWDDDLDHNIF